MRRKTEISTVFILSLSLLACEAKEKSAMDAAPASPAADPADAASAPKAKIAAADAAAEAEKFYTSICVICHGTSGAGDGPGSAALDPMPRDFGDKEWQAKVSDEHLSKIILDGGVAGGLSPLMPGNPRLKTKPELLAELVKKIRSFGK